MKKILAFMLSIMIVFSAEAISVSAAETELTNTGSYESGGLSDEKITTAEGYIYFINDDGTATVCGVPKDEIDIVIPATVDGLKVTSIDTHCQRFTCNTEARSFTVPEGVIHIGFYVVWHLRNIEMFNYPSTIQKIEGSEGYKSTPYYKNPDNWDNGMLYIGTNLIAITEFPKDDILVLRKNTTCIADEIIHGSLLSQESTITEVVLPDNYTHDIGKVLFTSVETITVPSGFEKIPNKFMRSHENLKSVTLEDGVSYIGCAAFSGCSNLSHIYIPDSVEYIGEYAFGYSAEYANIDFSEQIKLSMDYSLNSPYYDYEYTADDSLTMYGSADNEVAKAYAQENGVEYISVKSRAQYEEIVGVESELPDNDATVDETEVLGDVNSDGKLNIRDATAIQKYLAKMTDFNDAQLSVADFDQNGKVNVKDATAIQKKIAGLI